LIKHITDNEVIDWVSKQKDIHKRHTDFYRWKKHILVISKIWPQCRKFYEGNGKFLGYFDDELKAVYWYNKIGDEMYDGYLLSSKPGAGIKLGRYLQNEIDWKENWSLCEKEYLNYNIRLGYEVKDISKFNNEEWILLWRQKKY
tara:strand:- start:161 stop:592 length:432 start_codon:yes stop_codon:yes gene_type:complete